MRVLRRATDGAPPSPSTTTITGSASHTMNAWTPQEAGLREILQTIHESTDTQNVAVQRNITHVPLISPSSSFHTSLTIPTSILTLHRNSTALRVCQTTSHILPTSFLRYLRSRTESGPSQVTSSRIMLPSSSGRPQRSSSSSKPPSSMLSPIQAV